MTKITAFFKTPVIVDNIKVREVTHHTFEVRESGDLTRSAFGLYFKKQWADETYEVWVPWSNVLGLVRAATE